MRPPRGVMLAVLATLVLSLSGVVGAAGEASAQTVAPVQQAPSLPVGCASPTGVHVVNLAALQPGQIGPWLQSQAGCSNRIVLQNGSTCRHSLGTLPSDRETLLNWLGNLLHPVRLLFPSSWFSSPFLTSDVNRTLIVVVRCALHPNAVEAMAATVPARTFASYIGYLRDGQAGNPTHSISCLSDGQLQATFGSSTASWAQPIYWPSPSPDYSFGCTIRTATSNGAAAGVIERFGPMDECGGHLFRHLGASMTRTVEILPSGGDGTFACVEGQTPSIQPGTCCFPPEFEPGLPGVNLGGCDRFSVLSEDRSGVFVLPGDPLPMWLGSRVTPPPEPQPVEVTVYSDDGAGSRQDFDLFWPDNVNFSPVAPPKAGVPGTEPRLASYIGLRLFCPIDGSVSYQRYDITGQGGSADDPVGTWPGYGPGLQACLDDAVDNDFLLIGPLIEALVCLVEVVLIPGRPLPYWITSYRGIVNGSAVGDAVRVGQAPFDAARFVASAPGGSTTSFAFMGQTVNLPAAPSNVVSLLRNGMTLFLLFAVLVRIAVLVGGSLGVPTPWSNKEGGRAGGGDGD